MLYTHHLEHLLKMILFLFDYVYVCEYVRVSSSDHGAQEKGQIPWS